MHVAIIGAGIIGAACAWRLARAGAAVTVIDAATPAGGASGRSFGWINASFHLNEDHFRLRREAIAAWHRAERDLGRRLATWSGALCWEEPEQQEAQHAALTGLGYDVAWQEAPAIAVLEPALSHAPERALHFPGEGAADAARVTLALLDAARAEGARVLCGVAVEGVEHHGGAVSALRLPGGPLAVDHVVMAAGTGAEALLRPLDISLPLPPRPGLILRTMPQSFRLNHILVTPLGEIRQDEEGAILLPTTVGHQADEAEALTASPQDLADRALTLLRRLLPGLSGGWSGVTLGYRPVPPDGLPAIGPAGPAGLTVAVMHSGVTLGPIVGEAVAELVLKGSLSDLIRPFPADRFVPGAKEQPD